MKVLFEASGSLTGAYLLQAAREAGLQTVASDIVKDCYATQLADDFILMPKSNDPDLWKIIDSLLLQHQVDLVIPSLDETLLQWSERKDHFTEHNIQVVISDASTIEVFQDKWQTFQFFEEHGIPTPATSLTQEYDIVKPIHGRGSVGVDLFPNKNVDMTGLISQERLDGTEYTIDVLCDHESNPVYIIPRKRLNVVNGKSLNGITIHHEGIIGWVKKICSAISFYGPINIQCFETPQGELKFLEINPRIAGGMALGFAASENWFKLIHESIIQAKSIIPKPVKWGLKMKRYYAEVFIS